MSKLICMQLSWYLSWHIDQLCGVRWALPEEGLVIFASLSRSGGASGRPAIGSGLGEIEINWVCRLVWSCPSTIVSRHSLPSLGGLLLCSLPSFPSTTAFPFVLVSFLHQVGLFFHPSASSSTLVLPSLWVVFVCVCLTCLPANQSPFNRSASIRVPRSATFACLPNAHLNACTVTRMSQIWQHHPALANG